MKSIYSPFLFGMQLTFSTACTQVDPIVYSKEIIKLRFEYSTDDCNVAGNYMNNVLLGSQRYIWMRFQDGLIKFEDYSLYQKLFLLTKTSSQKKVKGYSLFIF